MVRISGSVRSEHRTKTTVEALWMEMVFSVTNIMRQASATRFKYRFEWNLFNAGQRSRAFSVPECIDTCTIHFLFYAQNIWCVCIGLEGWNPVRGSRPKRGANVILSVQDPVHIFLVLVVSFLGFSRQCMGKVAYFWGKSRLLSIT